MLLSNNGTRTVCRAIKQTSLLPADVKKSINFSYHSLSVTLFWPGIANCTMRMCFSTTLLNTKTDRPPSVRFVAFEITEGKAIVVLESVF